MIGRWMRWLGYSIGSAGILAFVVLAGVDWLADLRDDVVIELLEVDQLIAEPDGVAGQFLGVGL